MFIGKLIANGFLREEAGDGGANGGGGPVSLMAGTGNNAGGDGAGNGDGDGGEGDGGGSGGDGGSGASGAGAGMRYDLGDEAAMTAWREALGMNKEFAGEEFLPAAPEGLPEGVWDAEAVEVLGRKAWELGVPKEAVAGIVSEFAARSAEAQKAAEAAEVERVEGVKSELEALWGEGYDGHMQGAVKAINALCKMGGMGEEDAEEIRNDPAVGTNLRVLRLLAQMGAMLGDEGAKGLRASASGSGSGAAEAARIMNDPSHPLHEAFMSLDHPNHRFANSEYDRLMGLR